MSHNKSYPLFSGQNTNPYISYIFEEQLIISNIKSEKVERRMQKSLPMGEKSLYSLVEEEIPSSIE